MSFFGDDFFDDIVKEMFGDSPVNRSSRRVIKNESEERVIDYIEDEDFAYFVFELPGYSFEDISVKVKGKELEVEARKKNKENVKPYLKEFLSSGIYFKKTIPSGLKTKDFEYDFKNGVLEVKFKRK
jgi:HSP20 family molecular chaperone IbpA